MIGPTTDDSHESNNVNVNVNVNGNGNGNGYGNRDSSTIQDMINSFVTSSGCGRGRNRGEVGTLQSTELHPLFMWLSYSMPAQKRPMSIIHTTNNIHTAVAVAYAHAHAHNQPCRIGAAMIIRDEDKDDDDDDEEEKHGLWQLLYYSIQRLLPIMND